MTDETTRTRGRPRALMAAIALFAASVGFGAVYVMARGADNVVGTSGAGRPGDERTAQAAPALPAGAGANALSQGHMAAFVFRKTPEALPATTFLDGSGQERRLADFKGRVDAERPLSGKGREPIACISTAGFFN